MTFGQHIRALRKELGLSQRELAQRVRIDFTYLSKIENGVAEAPSEAVIGRLARELSADADELTVLAGKIPSDLAEVLANNPDQLRYLRALKSGRKRKG